MTRKGIIQNLFEFIRNFFSHLDHRQWTSGEIIFIALFFLIIIFAVMLFFVFNSKKPRKKEYE